MADAIDIIKRRLKEERIPDAPWPDEVSEKKKRPREVAFMDVNLCFPCGKCPEFCPVQCIEYLAPNSVPGRGLQPVQDRFQECIGCYICVEVCALLTDYDAIRMYDVTLVEELHRCEDRRQEAGRVRPGPALRRVLLRRWQPVRAPPRSRLAHLGQDERRGETDIERREGARVDR